MCGSYGRRARGIRIFGATFAIWSISIGGSVLALLIPSAGMQTAIQIGSCGAFAGIILRMFAGANAVIAAATQLADQLAKAHELQPHDRDRDDGRSRLAAVVELPEQRRDRAKRPEAS